MHFCHLSLCQEGVHGISWLVVSLFCHCITFCEECKLCSSDIGWGTGKMTSVLDGSLRSDIFSALQMKGHVLHCTRMHLKVSGWSLVWNALLTKKLPMFLLHLNEIKGCEEILPESRSFWSNNLKFFKNDGFYCVVVSQGEMWGWMEFYHY